MKIHKYTSKLKKNLQQMAINVLFCFIMYLSIHLS